MDITENIISSIPVSWKSPCS